MAHYSKETNDQLRDENLEFLEKDREMAHIWSIAYKDKIKTYFNKQVHPWDFHKEDLILRKTNSPRKETGEGKTLTNWERPYRVIESLENEDYHLESIDGKKLPQTWNSSHIWKYYVQIIWQRQSIKWCLLHWLAIL